MKKRDVVKYFGNMARAMKAIGYSRSIAVKWDEVIPAQYAVSFVVASDGKLQLGFEDYPLAKANDQVTKQAA